MRIGGLAERGAVVAQLTAIIGSPAPHLTDRFSGDDRAGKIRADTYRCSTRDQYTSRIIRVVD